MVERELDVATLQTASDQIRLNVGGFGSDWQRRVGRSEQRMNRSNRGQPDLKSRHCSASQDLNVLAADPQP